MRALRREQEALEALRARTLIIRAHERQTGATTAAWRRICEAMRVVHSLPEIARVSRESRDLLEAIERVSAEGGVTVGVFGSTEKAYVDATEPPVVVTTIGAVAAAAGSLFRVMVVDVTV